MTGWTDKPGAPRTSVQVTVQRAGMTQDLVYQEHGLPAVEGLYSVHPDQERCRPMRVARLDLAPAGKWFLRDGDPPVTLPWEQWYP